MAKCPLKAGHHPMDSECTADCAWWCRESTGNESLEICAVVAIATHLAKMVENMVDNAAAAQNRELWRVV